MKTFFIKRWWYKVFRGHQCFKNTLAERCDKWGDLVQPGRDIYLGNDWWYRPIKAGVK